MQPKCIVYHAQRSLSSKMYRRNLQTPDTKLQCTIQVTHCLVLGVFLLTSIDIKQKLNCVFVSFGFQLSISFTCQKFSCYLLQFNVTKKADNYHMQHRKSQCFDQWLNYSARGGGSLQARGLKGRSSSLKGLRAEVGFPTADQGLSSIQGTMFGFYDI